MRGVTFFALFLSSVAFLRGGSIVLTPGSLLLAHPTSAITTANTISYTKAGVMLGTGQINGTDDLAEAMTVLNGDLFVSDGSGRVNLINLSSGAVVSSFGTNMVGLDGLGTLDANLIAVSFASTAVNVYSPSGALQQSIVLASLPNSFDWAGLASDGTTLYIGDFSSGRIYEYNSAGTQVGFINTGLANAIGNFSYDASNNSIWATSTNEVTDFSLTGTVLREFSTGSFPSDAIAVVPNSAVPEPGNGALVSLALAFVLAARRSCRS